MGIAQAVGYWHADKDILTYCHKEVCDRDRYSRAEFQNFKADTGPNDKEVKMGDQAKDTTYLY